MTTDQTVYEINDKKVVVDINYGDRAYKARIIDMSKRPPMTKRAKYQTLDTRLSDDFLNLMRTASPRSVYKILYDIIHKLKHYYDPKIFDVMSFTRLYNLSYLGASYCEVYCFDASNEIWITIHENLSIQVYWIKIHFDGSMCPFIQAMRSIKYSSDEALSILEFEIYLAKDNENEKSMHTDIYNTYYSVYALYVIKVIIEMQLFPLPLCNIIRSYLTHRS